jgi:hypothetical protein
VELFQQINSSPSIAGLGRQALQESRHPHKQQPDNIARKEPISKEHIQEAVAFLLLA